MSFSNKNLLAEAELQLTEYALRGAPETQSEAALISIACSLLVATRELAELNKTLSHKVGL